MPKIKRKRFIVTAWVILFALTALTPFTVIEPVVPLPFFRTLDKSKLFACDKDVSIVAANGEYLCRGFERVESSELNDYTPNAFIAIEDKRFYSHKGVDWLRVAAAAKNDVLCGKFAEGASTITQQLVKNTHLCGDKTIKRKIEEIRIARQIERSFSKKEILDAYLSVVYFGNGIYGLEEASSVYFAKDASKLTLSESAMLAGIINNPSFYNPVSHYDNAVSRMKIVLKRMRSQGLIDAEEYSSAVSDKPIISDKKDYDAFYVAYVKNEAKKLLSERQYPLKNCTIITYCDRELNKLCGVLCEKYSTADRFVEIAVYDNGTGACVAKAGKMQNVRRQPGSTVKPFVCYAPAYEKRLVYPVTPIVDEKTDFGGYCPENADKKYHGAVSVNKSLINSYNIPAVKLLKSSGVVYAKNIAEKCGIPFDKSDNSLAVALGAMKNGVTLDNLAEGYCTLARGGEHLPSYSVGAITDGDGKFLYSHRAVRTHAIGDDTAFLITDALMQCATDGTAKRLKNSSSGDIAAKTGTVGTKTGNTDAYCIAYSPEKTIAVRISALNGTQFPNEICGATVPCSIAAEIIVHACGNEKFVVPDSVIKAEISRPQLENKGKIVLAGANEYKKNAISTWFSKNNVPFVSDRWYDGRLDDFDYFEVVDALVD